MIYDRSYARCVLDLSDRDVASARKQNSDSKRRLGLRVFSFSLFFSFLRRVDVRRGKKGEARYGREAAKRFRKIHSVEEYTGFHHRRTQWRVLEKGR